MKTAFEDFSLSIGLLSSFFFFQNLLWERKEAFVIALKLFSFLSVRVKRKGKIWNVYDIDKLLLIYLHTQFIQGSFRNDLLTLHDYQCLLKYNTSQDFIVTGRNSTLYKCCQGIFILFIIIIFLSLSTSNLTPM